MSRNLFRIAGVLLLTVVGMLSHANTASAVGCFWTDRTYNASTGDFRFAGRAASELGTVVIFVESGSGALSTDSAWKMVATSVAGTAPLGNYVAWVDCLDEVSSQTLFFNWSVSPPVPIPTPTPPGGGGGGGGLDRADFISQVIPKTTMETGEQMQVSVRIRNCRQNGDCSGLSTWTPGANYRLGSQNPQDNSTWGTGRVNLAAGTSVAPGTEYTYTFTITAPSVPGSYNFQWRSVHEGVTWFGETSPNVVITVVPAPPTGTINTITSPRSTVLTSVGQPSGTISGTVSGGTGSGYAVQTVIRRGSGATCNDWISGAWSTTCGVSTPPATLSGTTWTLSGTSVPPASAMTSGQTYRVYLNVRDSSGVWSNWSVGTPLILYQLPTGTINTITSPRSTVLTSVGQLDGSGIITGTVSGGTGSGYTVQTVIRRGTGATCDDWVSGAWSTTCTVSNPPAVLSGTTWTLSGSSVPPASAMTSGQTYRVYLDVRDSSGTRSGWISTPLILYQLPTGTIDTITSPRSTVLTSVGRPSGIISGTVSGGTGSGYTVQTVIRRGSGGCNDWISGTWSTTCGASNPPATLSGTAWALFGTSVPPVSAMTSGETYRVYLDVRDSSGTRSGWIGTPLILYQLPVPPTSTILSVDQPDYCQSGPDATVNWQYTSPEGIPQGAWRLQVATDPGFTSLAYDSGIMPGTTLSASVGPGILQFAGSYYARVKVWDNTGLEQLGWSGALLFSITATGPYPQAQFTFDPPNPAAGQEIQFTDGSSRNPSSWLWNFGDGGTALDQNPLYTYAAPGSYTITLDVTNAHGTCQATRIIGAQESIPSFKEVRP